MAKITLDFAVVTEEETMALYQEFIEYLLDFGCNNPDVRAMTYEELKEYHATRNPNSNDFTLTGHIDDIKLYLKEKYCVGMTEEDIKETINSIEDSGDVK